MIKDTPKKSLGQHWLSDQAALKSIVKAAELSLTDTILEIGPGPGALTQHLVKQAKKVIAVELDSHLAKRLSSTVKADNLQVVEADILKFDLSGLPAGYKVVANIPYYLTGKLLRVLIESPNPPVKMVLLVQKEVAQRLAAQPGQMSMLAISAQLDYEVTSGEVIPAALFVPSPKVDSQVAILSRRPKSLFMDLDRQEFFQVVKAGFATKRKKLRSTLSAGLRISKGQVDELLQKSGINSDARAQELTLQQWHNLYKTYRQN